MPGVEPPPDVGTGSSWDEVVAAGIGGDSVVPSLRGLLLPDMARRGHQYRVVVATKLIGFIILYKLEISTIQNLVRK